MIKRIKYYISKFHNKMDVRNYCKRMIRENGTVIISPLELDGKENFTIGRNVGINYKTWLAAKPLTGKNVELSIGDGTVIGHFCHIYATQLIKIEENVLIADKVYISDNLHGYEDINVPIMNQPIRQKNEVIIGRDSWIGENVCVLGAKIGQHCVIGSNSVVTHDIPDFSVAVGAPAKVIKKYSFETKQWENINE